MFKYIDIFILEVYRHLHFPHITCLVNAYYTSQPDLFRPSDVNTQENHLSNSLMEAHTGDTQIVGTSKALQHRLVNFPVWVSSGGHEKKPTQTMQVYGKSLKIAIHLHCLMPPKPGVKFMSPRVHFTSWHPPSLSAPGPAGAVSFSAGASGSASAPPGSPGVVGWSTVPWFWGLIFRWGKVEISRFPRPESLQKKQRTPTPFSQNKKVRLPTSSIPACTFLRRWNITLADIQGFEKTPWRFQLLWHPSWQAIKKTHQPWRVQSCRLYTFCLFLITQENSLEPFCLLPFPSVFRSQLKVRGRHRFFSQLMAVPNVIHWYYNSNTAAAFVRKFWVETILLRHHLFILQICFIVIYCLLNIFNELQQLRCSKICLGWGLVPLFTFSYIKVEVKQHVSIQTIDSMPVRRKISNEYSRQQNPAVKGKRPSNECFKQSYDQNIWR